MQCQQQKCPVDNFFIYNPDWQIFIQLYREYLSVEKMNQVCAFHTVEQARRFEAGGGCCGQVTCYCDTTYESRIAYLEAMSQYDQILVQKWIYGIQHQPLDKVPENALSIPRCRSCRYIQAYLYEHGKDVLETCKCERDDDDYTGLRSDAKEHPLVLKWLGEEEVGKPSACKQSQQ